ncbi:FeoB-associated Cys-rich membrane protein [Clostridium sp. MSJ-8]|uniref:FeoB-associated Cys-rich membrane protein n=1 Tax=Clostridium sp. MSJ-8 TaxID=2841510 RepID=UPI001C0F2670|nr:FeoB-associated Cys-rich membrane protein [Clostridium sp. MSJ-8]MBU5487740.1 FeoB-associated Cys-rich membrane protein [Clostridium sp. MSJ-8]
MEWLINNIANIVISLILLIIFICIIRYIIKTNKKGGCIGCDGDCNKHSCHNNNGIKLQK